MSSLSRSVRLALIALVLAAAGPRLAHGMRAPALSGTRALSARARVPPRSAPALVADVIAEAAALQPVVGSVVQQAVDAVQQDEASHWNHFWSTFLLYSSGVYASHRNARIIEARRYADAERKRGPRRSRQRALPPVRARREAVAPRGGGSAEDELLDTFRW